MWGETDAQKNWNDYWKQQGINNRPKKHFPWKFIIFLSIITICVGQQIIKDKLSNYTPKETNYYPSTDNKINLTHNPNPGTIDYQTNQYFTILKNFNIHIADTVEYLVFSINGNFDQQIFNQKVEKTKNIYLELTNTDINKNYKILKTQTEKNYKKIIDSLNNESKTNEHNLATVSKITISSQNYAEQCMDTIITLFDENNIEYEICYKDKEQTKIDNISYRYTPYE